MSDGTWIVIPARGGSQGIPRKNLVLCGGKPLIQYAIDTSVSVVGHNRVVVISDDREIDWFARQFGVKTILESERSGPYETLDEKIVRNVPQLRILGAADDDVVLTVQPTSPLLRVESVAKALQQLREGAGSVISVVEDRHLTWALSGQNQQAKPLFKNRVNRQEIEPIFRETGGILGARLGDIEAHETRVVDPVGLVVVSGREGVDIDSHGELFEAEHWLTRGRIVIRADVGANRGMGHLYRGLAIALELSRHEVIFAMSGDAVIVESVLRDYPFASLMVGDEEVFLDLLAEEQPDLLVSDVLDTTATQVRAWRDKAPGMKIITFEDEGAGAQLCDARVYDLTAPTDPHSPKTICGISKSILAPSFELVSGRKDNQLDGPELLVTFGGSDPAGLTGKVLEALELLDFGGAVTVVSGLGAEKPDLSNLRIDVTFLENVTNMALVMANHRIAISSMGRTVFELATCGVPVLCFAQNEKETTHVHVGVETGSVFGGLGFTLSPAEIALRVGPFLADASLHQTLRVGATAFRSDRSNRNALAAALSAADLSHLV